MMSHRRPSLTTLLLIPAIQTTILSSLSVSAYIPAVAINDTSLLNLTDSSSITISWTDPPSVYSGAVSYQLEADIPTGGTTQGALVHFTESSIGPNFTTSTPWIAYVSCDVNETMASQEWGGSIRRCRVTKAFKVLICHRYIHVGSRSGGCIGGKTPPAILWYLMD